MPLSVAPSTDLYASGNAPSTAAWQNAPPAAAFGSAPAPTTPQITAGPAVGTSMALGKQVYNQLPGYSADISGIGANVGAEIAGELPPDVVTQLTNEAAARGIGTGTGAASVNEDLLKTLGLNSLQLTQMGQQGLDTQLGMLPGATLYQNPQFYPGSAQLQQAQQQNALNQAAPNPQAAAMAALRTAGSGYAAGGGSGISLPGAPTTTSVFPGGNNATLGMLNQMVQAYTPPSYLPLTTGNMYGGGNTSEAGSLADDEEENASGTQTGYGASETALAPDVVSAFYGAPDNQSD